VNVVEDAVFGHEKSITLERTNKTAERADRELMTARFVSERTPVVDGDFFVGLDHIPYIEMRINLSTIV